MLVLRWGLLLSLSALSRPDLICLVLLNTICALAAVTLLSADLHLSPGSVQPPPRPPMLLSDSGCSLTCWCLVLLSAFPSGFTPEETPVGTLMSSIVCGFSSEFLTYSAYPFRVAHLPWSACGDEQSALPLQRLLLCQDTLEKHCLLPTSQWEVVLPLFLGTQHISDQFIWIKIF